MKNLLAALLVGLLAFQLTDGLRGADGPPFSVTIRPRQETVMAGHDVTLDMTLTNISGKTFRVKIFPPQVEYTLEVNGPDGQPAEMTDNGRNITKNAPEEMKTSPYFEQRGYLSVTLLPGQVYKDAIKVDDMYSLWPPGIYTVKVRRAIPDQLGKGEVESNTVNITITYNPAVEKIPGGNK